MNHLGTVEIETKIEIIMIALEIIQSLFYV
ncbi:MAG: hypothetical protein K0R54_5881 [Clostridiaceae bacterium]|jgi:hypothetical protein|nr:hypothetical protein [Clostridiaceae bacterium]